MKKIIFTSLMLSSYVVAATLSPVQENSLIIYNSNLGLVHEKRDLSLRKNDTFINYEDVASSINTDSVNVSIDPSVTLFSQQYRYDKLTQAKLLDAHIGKKVEVRQLKNRNEFQIISAILLSHNGSQAIVKTLDYKIITVKSADIQFDTIPSELITKPSLVWNINASKDLDGSLELDYLIKNITFKSDYILNLDEKTSNLDGWISINNHSGKAFKETTLSLLAGDINRAQQQNIRVYKSKAINMMTDTPQVAHQAFEGYHFYTIPFKVNLANNEKTQIKFLSQDNIPTTKNYEATLNNPLYLMGERKSDVLQYVSLQKLNTPLPKGTIRTYGTLAGKKILLGETNISHTPKDTPIKLKLGTNFDLKVKQTLLKRDDTKERFDVSIKYTITNHSDEPKEITLFVPFNKNSDSSITTKEKYTFTKGNLVTFTFIIPINETKEFQVNFKSKR
jgi:hypothetical protein